MSAPRLFPINFIMMTSRILLVLVVLTSSLAWMPSTAQAAPQTETSATPKVVAWIAGARLYVEARGLPRSHNFSLRARRTSDNDWIKLARVKSNRHGELVKNARLPSYLTRYDHLQVCLKDLRTDRSYCARSKRQY